MAAVDPPGFGAGLDRRTLLRVTGVAGAATLFSAANGAPAVAAADPRRVYVLVVDGCRPGEINPDRTPVLARMRDRGFDYPRAQSLPVMETIPNHVMMMTGVRPDRTHVPANSIYDREAGEVRTLDRPSDLRFPTVLTRLDRAGFTTGTVLSKTYLYGIIGDRATYRWEPQPTIPISGHTPDAVTVDAAIDMVREIDPSLVFVNLGDVDRFGHSDLTGTTLQAARRAALADTDAQVGRFVDMLKDTGRWQDAVVVVLADHSMDWSTPDAIVNLSPRFEEDPLLTGRVRFADNGGADLLYWVGAASSRDRAVRRMRRIALQHPGVLSVHPPDELRLGPEAGDLVAYCRAGYRFSDPEYTNNPIPGNHGHPATLPIPFFLSGGSPAVRRGSSTARAHTLDVAPTIGEVFGLGAPRGGYDGRSRLP